MNKRPTGPALLTLLFQILGSIPQYMYHACSQNYPSTKHLAFWFQGKIQLKSKALN